MHLSVMVTVGEVSIFVCCVLGIQSGFLTILTLDSGDAVERGTRLVKFMLETTPDSVMHINQEPL